jgi:hypothetical protein
MNIEELYDLFVEQRNIDLDLEQFTLFTEFFPAVLVILSDGVMDTREKLYLEKLINSLANAFTNEGGGNKHIHKLQHIFSQAFDFLIQHLEEWKDKFLLALKSHLAEFPESKETILDTIHLFAETSQDVDEAEGNMVRFLTEKLNLLG